MCFPLLDRIQASPHTVSFVHFHLRTRLPLCPSTPHFSIYTYSTNTTPRSLLGYDPEVPIICATCLLLVHLSFLPYTPLLHHDV